MMVVSRGGPILNIVYDYSFDELLGLYREAIDPETQDLVYDTQGETDYPIKMAQKLSVNNNLT